MCKQILFVVVLFYLISCENTEGQYRHDRKHHDSKPKLYGENNFSHSFSLKVFPIKYFAHF